MKTSSIRKPAVAGSFYPDDPGSLREMISGYLRAVPPAGGVPKAVIAPHAGYVYSGPIAASVYARVAPARDRIRRVVLLGPTHRVPFAGMAVSHAGGFATPFGIVPVDRESVSRILEFPQVMMLDAAHAMEHSLEVQLPFLQMVLDSFLLVPIAVGDADPPAVAEVINALWGGEETLIVVSSDLSHYHDYETAQKMDLLTSSAIEQLEPDKIEYDQACGRMPIAGMLLAAREHGLTCHRVDLRNSGDTAGPRDQVVGYGAYVFE